MAARGRAAYLRAHGVAIAEAISCSTTLSAGQSAATGRAPPVPDPDPVKRRARENENGFIITIQYSYLCADVWI